MTTALAPMFSSVRQDWATPKFLFDALDAEFDFTLDACATVENAKLPRFYTIEDNGLQQEWGNERVFMNPPYGREIGAWMKKAYESSKFGALVVCLIPARTDTSWWHDFAAQGEVRFLRGRVKFNPLKDAPFPSAVVVFRPKP